MDGDQMFHQSHHMVRDAADGTMEKEDVALLKTPVAKERGTAMVPVMEDNMMVMLDVEEVLSVEATTVRSSEPTSMKKMTAVKDQTHLQVVLVVQEVLDHLETETGATGALGVNVTKDVEEERR